MILRLLVLLAGVLVLGTAVPVAASPTGPGAEERAEGTSVPGQAPAGDRQREVPEEFQGIGVDEQLGSAVTPSLSFTDSEGRVLTLGEVLSGDLPVVMAFVYHNCPMLCSLVLNGLTNTMREAGMVAGRDYRALAVSIDPRDTPERAAEAKELYARRLEEGGDGYIFLTGSEEAIAQLTEEVGFRYRWVEAQQEFAHTASLVFLSPTGQITRYLYGIDFAASDFQMALREARAGTVGSSVDQLLLYCFAYDPDAGSYVLHAVNTMKLGGLLTLLVLGGALFVFWRRERRKNAAALRTPGARWGDYEEGLRALPNP